MAQDDAIYAVLAVSSVVALSCASSGLSRNHPRAFLEPSWAILGCLKPSWAGLSLVLLLSWGVFEVSWAVLGLSWAILALSWACPGSSWHPPGLSGSHLEPSWPRSRKWRKNATKNLPEPIDFGDHFGVISGSFSLSFSRLIFEQFWDHFQIIFGLLLVSFWIPDLPQARPDGFQRAVKSSKAAKRCLSKNNPNLLFVQGFWGPETS